MLTHTVVSKMLTNTYTHTNTHMLTHTHTSSCSNMHTPPTRTHTHSNSHICTNTYTPPTRTHTHTHTKYPPAVWRCSSGAGQRLQFLIHLSAGAKSRSLN